jgi:hypothetical protein
LGVAELVAVWTGPQSTPLAAVGVVGGAIVDGVPEPLKAFAIRRVYDKNALLTGTAIRRCCVVG